MPADLPRREVVHDIAEEEKQCGCGDALSCIGQDVSEKLDSVPAKLRVTRHIRLKYACKSCEGVEDEGPTVKIAPVPDWLFAEPPNGADAGATFYSLVETAKADGLEPYNYLRYIFEKLPLAQTDQGYRNLLPQYVDREDLLASLP